MYQSWLAPSLHIKLKDKARGKKHRSICIFVQGCQKHLYACQFLVSQHNNRLGFHMTIDGVFDWWLKFNSPLFFRCCDLQWFNDMVLYRVFPQCISVVRFFSGEAVSCNVDHYWKKKKLHVKEHSTEHILLHADL